MNPPQENQTAERKAAVRLHSWLLLAVLSLLISCGGSPDLPPGPKVEVVIEPGMSTAQVARVLRAAGVIDNELLFRFRCWYEECEGAIQPGRYRFPRHCSPNSCLRVLTGRAPAYVMLTIPEGLTMHQTAHLLAANRICDSAEFIAACTDSTLLRQLEIPFATAEGFLFPETYEFITGTPPDQIVKRLVRQFRTVISQLTSRSTVTRPIREVVILASIVEKEARLPEERPVIAGVFVNRLQRRLPLMSCATVEYALGMHKPVLSYDDTRFESPYNTYLHPNLPPGPICSPGKAALAAALNPARHDYLFFVATGNGGHIFSRTPAEHDAAVNAVAGSRQALQPGSRNSSRQHHR